MSVYLKRVIASVLFVAGIFGLLWGSSEIFEPHGKQTEFGIEDPDATAIVDEKPQTLDVVVFGDSESYSNIVPLEIWKEAGITTFICGTSAQQLSYTEALIKRTFKTQSPKIIILETNALFRKVPSAQLTVNMMSEYFSIFSYHNRWKSVLDFRKKSSEDSGNHKGYKHSSNAKPAYPGDYMKYTDEVADISDVNKHYIESIKKLCDEKGAELVFLSTPSCKNWNYKRHNAVDLVAKDLGCRFIDLNLETDKIGIDWEYDTRDNGDHLNHQGAVKTSKYILGYLQQIKSFADKRTDPEYKEWNEKLQKYETFIEEERLEKQEKEKQDKKDGKDGKGKK